MRCLAVLYGRRVRAVQDVLVFSVMTVDRNGAGRGLNFVVVNSDTKEVVRVARFDTFASGSYLSRRLAAANAVPATTLLTYLVESATRINLIPSSPRITIV